MILYRQEFPVKEMDFIHAGEASVGVKNILKDIGVDGNLIKRAAIAAYEAEMNAVIYGINGRMILELYENRIVIEVGDTGPGIADVDLAMQEGYSTAPPEIKEMGFGAGMGLPNIAKNADKLEIHTEVDEGTRLVMVFLTGWGGKA